MAGDQYAFEELFYRHHRQLDRLAQITSRNPEDAADALQDAMLKAHQGTVKSRCSRARAKLAEALEYFNAGAAAAAERTGTRDGTGAV